MICGQFIIIEFVSRLASLIELMEKLKLVMDDSDLFSIRFRIGYLCHSSSDLVQDILNSSNLLIIHSI